MARSRVLEVRLERQPHRDAVYRLRQAYRRLRWASQTSQTWDDPRTEAVSWSPPSVQEVKR